MPSADVDAEKIISVLEQFKVRYVVIGGFAVELWDVSIEPTVDVDITPEMSVSNLKRLAAALNELEAGIRSGSETIMVPGGFRAETLSQMTVLSLNTVAGPLDLTIRPAGFAGYTDLAENSLEIAFGDLLVPTADLRDVAHSKESVGRPKDLKALPAIHAHINKLDRG